MYGKIDMQKVGRVLGLVVEWASIHKEGLLLDWEAAKARKPLSKIEPLQ